jgi:hypothetical protein
MGLSPPSSEHFPYLSRHATRLRLSQPSLRLRQRFAQLRALGGLPPRTRTCSASPTHSLCSKISTAE